jgi:hypothetical protein
MSGSAITPISSNGVASESIDTKLNATANPAIDVGLPIDTEQNDWSTSSLSVVVVGASGDLAKKKIFPALFALHYEGLLPKNFQIFGYARSKMTDAEFRDLIARTLTCRIDARAKCAEAQEQFLARCFYQAVRGKLACTLTSIQPDQCLLQCSAVNWHPGSGTSSGASSAFDGTPCGATLDSNVVQCTARCTNLHRNSMPSCHHTLQYVSS